MRWIAITLAAMTVYSVHATPLVKLETENKVSFYKINSNGLSPNKTLSTSNYSYQKREHIKVDESLHNTLITSYLKNFLNCDNSDSKQLNRWIEQRRDSYKPELYLTELPNDYLVLSNTYKQNVSLIKNSEVLSQCVVSNKNFFYSDNKKYLAIVSQKIEEVEFLETPKVIHSNIDSEEEYTTILYELGDIPNPVFEIKSEERVKDIYISNSGEVYILFEELHLQWFKLLHLISGHPSYKSDIRFVKYNNKGQIVIDKSLGTGLKNPYVSFVTSH
ncbi:hypothetical protein RI844_00475 [Thalassotalea fonticola]|uniref:Uncharacterized protein n=1 Tax=Thalassotalea fonticola TaxID=3065649 RepID=A0ABZ0GPL5_9GAMM|nr:hypothetical protein RI844_00475 [Colwelliaceae bacterium S1-1]